jgi:signal transduction histidine kinase
VSLRPTVRLRLTLLYGGMFLAAGAVLLTVNYALVRRGIDSALPGTELRVPLPPGPRPLGDGTLLPSPEEERVIADKVERATRSVRDRALHALVVQSGLALGAMSVVSVGLGYVVAGRALRPLHEITAAARRLGEQNLHERIALRGPQDELKELADTFDDMLARLDAAFASQRRFVANASHELRTPLAVMRAESDLALADPHAGEETLRAMARSVRDAVDRTERLLESLLVLARSDRGVDRREPVDLAVVAGDVLTQAAPAQVGLEVRHRLTPAPVVGDPALLDRLVANLVENAVRHNVPGGWVEVSTRVVDRSVRLVVANSGGPVPEGEVERLFEPFRRGAVARLAARGDGPVGVGLGLSIVRSVARAHGGDAVARAIRGGGLEVAVSLPVGGQPVRPGPALEAARAG